MLLSLRQDTRFRKIKPTSGRKHHPTPCAAEVALLINGISFLNADEILKKRREKKTCAIHIGGQTIDRAFVITDITAMICCKSVDLPTHAVASGCHKVD